MIIGFVLVGIAIFPVLAILYFVRHKYLGIWLPAYLRRLTARSSNPVSQGPVDLFFCIADHFEPGFQKPAIEVERRRVDEWVSRYPELASRFRDCEGRPLQYTFFYPEEEYRAEHLDKLAQICKSGFGDVEIHLHHDRDTAEGFREKLVRFKTILNKRHGLLRTDESGEIVYAFIHGNWALDNSAEGGHWCGVDNELQILRQTGCYADLTMPSAPSETQTRKINSIYYATDDPVRPKSHDSGIDVAVGRPASGDLMLIQGPLTLNWKNRKWGIFPRIENGELSGDNPATPDRVDLWVKQGISVKGRPDWVFIKVHTHGAKEMNREMLLGKPMEDALAYLCRVYNDGVRYRLHFVTAFEAYRIIRAAEAGAQEIPRLAVDKSGSSISGDAGNSEKNVESRPYAGVN